MGWAVTQIYLQALTWARGYKLCQDDIFYEYLSRISKRPDLHPVFNPTAP